MASSHSVLEQQAALSFASDEHAALKTMARRSMLGARATQYNASAEMDEPHDEDARKALSSGDPLAFAFAGLRFRDLAMESEYVAFYYRGRSSGIMFCGLSSLIVLAATVFRVVDIEPKHLVIYSLGVVALWSVCGVLLFALRQQWHRILTAPQSTDDTRSFGGSRSALRESQSSHALMQVDPDDDVAVRQAQLRNASRVELVTALVLVGDAVWAFASYYPKAECFGLTGSELEEHCARQFQIDASAIVVMAVSAVVTPVRLRYYIPLNVLSFGAFALAHFTPGAVPLDRPFMAFSICIMAVTALLCVAEVARHELKTRLQFREMIHVKMQAVELHAVRKKTEATLRGYQPLLFRGLLSLDEVLTEEAITVCLCVRNFAAWSSKQSPADVVEMLHILDDGIHKVFLTMPQETLQYPAFGDQWVFVCPLAPRLKADLSSQDVVPLDATVLLSDGLRCVCASICEGTRLIQAAQTATNADLYGAPSSACATLWVEGAVDVGITHVVPLSRQRSATCRGPAVDAVKALLEKTQQRFGTNRGAATQLLCVVGASVADALGIPLSQSTPAVSVAVPLERQGRSAEVNSVLLVAGSWLTDQLSACDNDDVWRLFYRRTEAPSLAASQTSDVAAPVGGVGAPSLVVSHMQSPESTGLPQLMPSLVVAPEAPMALDASRRSTASSTMRDIRSRLVVVSRLFVFGAFSDVAIQADYERQRRESTTPGDLVCNALYFLCGGGFVLVCSVMFSSASEGTASSMWQLQRSVPWAALLAFQAAAMTVCSTLMLFGCAPRPPAFVLMTFEWTYAALYIVAISIERQGTGMLAGGSIAWLFFLEYLLMSRPIWGGPLLLWALDAAVACPFAVMVLMSDDVSSIVALRVALCFVSLVRTFAFRIVLERDRMARYATQRSSVLVREALREDYQRLQSAIEVFAPEAAASELTKHQQRLNANRAAAMVMRGTPQWGLSLTTRVKDTVVAFLHIRQSTREPSRWLAALQRANSCCHTCVTEFSAALSSGRVPCGVVQLLKTSGDVVMFSIGDGGLKEGEAACLLVRFALQLRRALQGDILLAQGFQMCIASGPVVGSLIGQHTPTYELIGWPCTVSHALRVNDLHPPGAVTVTERVVRQCAVHWRFAAPRECAYPAHSLREVTFSSPLPVALRGVGTIRMSVVLETDTT